MHGASSQRWHSTFGAGHQTIPLDGKGLEEKGSRTTTGFVGEFSWFLTHPNCPCCKFLLFPSSAPEIGNFLSGRALFVGIKPVFGFHEEGITSKVKHVLVLRAASLMVPLSPPAAAGTVCLLHLLFGPWGVLGIVALFQIPCVLIWVSWNINTIRVSRIPLTSIFALSFVLQALCFRQQLKWDLNH